MPESKLPELDMRAELRAIITLAQEALDALDDEHEGRFTSAVVEVDDRSAAVREVVDNW